MAWIESHQTLANHPKTLKLARLLNVPRVTAIGHLHFLWWWALDYAQDGELSKFEDLDIAVAADWQGEPASFWQALIRAGFVDEDGTLHDWDDYAGRLIERRRADAERKREARAKGVQSPSGGHPEDGVRNPTVPNPTPPDQNESLAEKGASAPEEREGEPRYTKEFEQFIEAYGETEGPTRPAFTLWRRLKKADRAAAMAGIAKWRDSDKWRDGFKPYPARYLRERVWTTEPLPRRTRDDPNATLLRPGANGHITPEERERLEEVRRQALARDGETAEERWERLHPDLAARVRVMGGGGG